jgi:hypothetical protein
MQLTFKAYHDREALNAYDFHHQITLVYDGVKVWPNHEREVIVDN